MVSYWDTSALVPLLVRETDTELRETQLLTVTGIVTWWATRTEAISALCRRRREGAITQKTFEEAMARLEKLSEQWSEVIPSEAMRKRSERILRIHPLRAADALQLAAALFATGEQPEGAGFYTGDTRQGEAARNEGFVVW